MTRKPIDADQLPVLESLAALPLDEHRRAALAPALEGMLSQFDQLFDVDAGETPPAHSFDARWKDRP
ncbi:MAG: hypothetical protein ACXIU8_04610 [Alkalilacustris sp.]